MKRSKFVTLAMVGIGAWLSPNLRAQTVQNPKVSVSLPFSAMRQLRATPARSSRPTLHVTLQDGQQLALPMSADTSIWRDKDNDQSKENSLILRVGRQGEVLLRPDLSLLPPNAKIAKATLQAFVGWKERPGSAQITLFRVTSDWAENATYAKPFPTQNQVWNGLKADTDYTATPLATYQSQSIEKGGIAFEGLESVVTQWQSGAAANHGFLLQFKGGSANQVHLDAREAKERSANALILGGPDDAKIVLSPNTALLQSVPLRPDEVKDATLRLQFPDAPAPNQRAGISVAVFRALKAPPATGSASALAYDPKPVSVTPLSALDSEKWLRIPGVLPAVQSGALVVALQNDTKTPLKPLIVSDRSDAKKQPLLEIAIINHPNVQLFGNAVKPQPNVYTVMRDGHLSYGGQRLRLWGVVGYGDPARMRKMGFNAQRVWNPTSQLGGGTSASGAGEFYTVESARRGLPGPFQKGDGSKLDIADKHFAALKANGMFVMFAALTGTMPLDPALQDDSFLAGGDDWAQWKAEVLASKNKDSLARAAIYFDPRFQRLKLQHAGNLLNHLNPYTGKKYGEDEAIAVYEMWNEQGFMKRVLESGLALPPYFEAQAQKQWNDWLKARYPTEKELRAAWGSLKDGESLDTGSIRMAPIISQRADYPSERASDYIRFLESKEAAFHRTFVDFCRSQAPQGVGVNVAPFSFDTQYKPSVQWPYSKSRGEVNSFGMYYWNLDSQLTRPPSMYVIDANRIEGRASILYETNQGRPSPYRAEFPLRLATLSAWQDFDGVFWHYWGAGGQKSDEAFLVSPLPHISATHFWSGVHHEADPVMTSSMALAGQIFLSGAIQPAPAPQTIRVGKEGIFSFDLSNGVDARNATFARGSQLRFEPEGDFKVKIEGETPAPTAGAVRAGDEIVWDYANGRLLVDTPTAKIYVGKTAPSHRFKDGITLSGFSSPFIEWAMISADGKPLTGPGATQKALVTAQFNAENSGFDYDWSVSGSPTQQAKGFRSVGTAPVIVDKIDYTLSFPTRLNADYTTYDFALRQKSAQKIADSSTLRVRNSDAWMGVLDFTARGAAATPLAENGTPRPTLTSRGASIAAPTDARLASVFNPLPNLSWGDNYATSHRTIRDAAFVKTGVSAEDSSVAGDKTITLTEAEVFLDLPADIDVAFTGGAMRSITATFKRPPLLREAATALSAKLGAPTEQKIVGDQTKEDFVRWTLINPAANVDVRLAESQGIVTLTYRLQRR